MGCAGSNPLPAAGDAMAAATNGRATAIDGPPPPSQQQQQQHDVATDSADKSRSIVDKIVGNVNIDEMVKKIQDVTGSMENLMDETQEKLSSFFGKAEENAEDAEKTIKDKMNDSTMSDEPKIHRVILLTTEETTIIPMGVIESTTTTVEKSDSDEIEINEDRTETIAKDVEADENDKIQEAEDENVESVKVENENVQGTVEEKTE